MNSCGKSYHIANKVVISSAMLVRVGVYRQHSSTVPAVQVNVTNADTMSVAMSKKSFFVSSE